MTFVLGCKTRSFFCFDLRGYFDDVVFVKLADGSLACLTPEDRETMLRFANAAAYIVTTRKGAIRAMPERSEVEALLAAN